MSVRERPNRIDLVGLPDDVLAALSAEAEANERTLTQQVRFVLRQWASFGSPSPLERADRQAYGETAA